MVQIRTGLLFGSFNPPHLGHLIIAGHMLNEAHLQEVWFVVTPQNPLKEQHQLIDARHRLKMTQLAIEGDQRIKVCDVEFNMPRPSYTIDTLRVLTTQPHDRFFSMIIGSDIVCELNKWKDVEQITQLVEFLVYPRLHASCAPMVSDFPLSWVEAPVIEISSSFIRKSLSRKQDVRYLLPAAVLEYITRHQLYEGNDLQ